MNALRIATRRSTLARTQTQWVADRIASSLGIECALVEVESYGDLDRETPLAALPEVGAFTKALQAAVLDGDADVAVHSLKDLPTTQTPGLQIAAIPEREDHRDALIARSGTPIADLPAGARVGTGAPRREMQLREQRADLEIAPIRGNVDTRLRKVADGEYDATIVALAGLRRIGRQEEATEVLDFLPAPGQGALAVECRADAGDLIEMLGRTADPETAAAVGIERAWLAATGGGCRTSAAALAQIEDDIVLLDWFYDGRRGHVRGGAGDIDLLVEAAAGEAVR